MTVEELIKTHPTSADRKALLRCIDDCFDCADVCDAAGRIVTRQAEPDLDVMRATIEACAETCRACGAECRRCEQACNDLLVTIRGGEQS